MDIFNFSLLEKRGKVNTNYDMTILLLLLLKLQGRFG